MMVPRRLRRPHVLILLFIVSGLTLAGLIRVQPTALAATTFVVTNTNDSGAGSLRQAMLDANGNAGVDTITFSIGSGLKTISPISPLPVISEGVVIDGSTQPGFAGVPLIELNGQGIASFPNTGVLHITGGNTTVRSLIINRLSDGAITILDSGGNVIEGCYLGTDATGTAALAITGNLITINNAPNNVIGGTTVSKRNVISGSTGHGISIFGSGANGNLIQGNYIGLNAAGDAGLGNFGGIFLGSSNNIVGGTVANSRNVISDNNYAGIVMQVDGTSNNLIIGNYIGTNAAGDANIGNENYGIAIFYASTNKIGGTTPDTRNVISGNGWGISVSGSADNVIQGNYIGVGADGSTPLGNRVEGIRLVNSVNTTVGGTVAGAGNTIAFNGPTAEIGVGTGIEVLSATTQHIRRNSIFSNGRLGIDLQNDGVTANDSGDPDNGPNMGQNFPLITSVVSDASQTTITGTLNSTPNTTFNIDFFSNAACDPSGNGEGAQPFGVPITVNTNAAGDGSFGVAVSTPLPVGRAITATATDPAGNTSEFSPCDVSMAMGSAKFNSLSYKVIEDVGLATIRVDRVGGSASTLAVSYSTADITATAAHDYSAVSGTLTFADGETTKTFDVPILDDNVNEPEEALSLRLRNPANPDTVGSPNTVELVLQDKSILPVLTVENLNINEGDAGTTNATFTVSLFPATGKTITANYSTLAQDSTSGIDFQPVSGSLTFAPRITSHTVIVPVIGDTMDENNERFRLRLTNVVNAAATISGNAVIIDDDLPPTISIHDLFVNEGNTGTRNAHFVVSLSALSGKVVSANYSTSNGTAESPGDYAASSGQVFILPGEPGKTVAVPINGDTDNEANETLIVTLSAPSNAVMARAQATGTILNDDGNTVPIQLMIDESGPSPIQATALESTLLLRDPFQVLNNSSFDSQNQDRNTRVALFLSNLQLQAGAPSSSVVVNLVDSGNQTYNVPAEDVRTVIGFPFTQVVFRLPDNLPPGICTVKVVAQGQSSNSGTFRIKPQTSFF